MMKNHFEDLKEVPLLKGCAEEALKQVALGTNLREFKKGQYLFRANDPSFTLYYIQSGSADVLRETQEGEILFSHLGAGAVIGEMGLVDTLPRSASVRACSDVVALEIEKQSLLEALTENPEAFLNTFKMVSLRLRSSNAELERRFMELAESKRKLEESYDATVIALSQALEMRDKVTSGHSDRVTAYSLIIGRSIGLSSKQMMDLKLGAFLHDLGKIGVSDTILHKTGKLNADEWVVMKKHPTLGKQIIENIEFLEGAIDVIHCHHERWDGQGYPQGLLNEDIPIAARIFAVADVFDALTTRRPYKDAWSPQAALTEIREQTGTHFDPGVIAHFEKNFAEIEVLMKRSHAGHSIRAFTLTASVV